MEWNDMCKMGAKVFVFMNEERANGRLNGMEGC